MQKQLEKELIKLLILGLIVIAKSLFWFSKLTRLGSGTSLPGLLVEKFCPFVIKEISQNFEQIILISGTNGKTTTRALLVHIWENQGFEVCTNRGGANILRGIAATLLLNQRIFGGTKSQIAILEVEEATLPILTKYLTPNQLILTNIFRDQLDAYGEIDQTLSYFSQSIKKIQENQNLSINLNNSTILDQKSVSNLTNYIGNNKEKWENSDDFKNQNETKEFQKSNSNSNSNTNNSTGKVWQNWTKLRQNLSKKFQSKKIEKIKINSQNNSQTNKSKIENSSQNKGFQGFFGRQFPSQNIYESDFNSSSDKTFADNPIFDDQFEYKESDFNSDFVQKTQQETETTNKNNLENQANINQNNQLSIKNFSNNPDTNSNQNEQKTIYNENAKSRSNSDTKFLEPTNIHKISTLKIGKNSNKSSQVYPNKQNSDSVSKINQNSKIQKTQIIINLDDSKLLTCLEGCQLPIIGFGIATDSENKPTFEKTEIPFLPTFESTFVAQSIGIRNKISRFVVAIEDRELSIESNLTGFFNLYNTVAAIASCYKIFGEKIAPSIAVFQPVFGRGEIIDLKYGQTSLYLVKNPAGFEQVLDLISNNQENNQISLYQKTPKNNPHISKNSKLNLGFLINDKIADGKDLSWLWDVDFEKFGKNIQESKIITGGTRGADLLLRLQQAGFAATTENYHKNMDEFVSTIFQSRENWVICATYTAMMEFRTKIEKKTKLKKIDESGF